MHDRLRILHDPISYYRPWLALELPGVAAQRSALNRWICQTHGLPSASSRTVPGPLADRVIRGWRRVPATAWLLACARHRRHVLGSRWLPTQPPALHAFLRLGWPETSACWSAPPAPEMLLAWGGQQLQLGLGGHLPDWLHARLGLWFAGLPVVPAATLDAPPTFDMTCFLSAWNHAADLS